MRLTVTATDSEGYEVEQEGVIARDHRLELRFRHVPRPDGDGILLSSSLRDAIARAVLGQQAGSGTAWPFPESATSRDLCGEHAANLLARSARTTASFPIAFAPSALPLDDETSSIDDDETGLTATPAMREVVSARGASLAGSPIRYAIDGGVWDNAPFAAVLRAIDRSPASREVDRRLVYVIYTDEPLPEQPHDGEDRNARRNSSTRSRARSRRRPMSRSPTTSNGSVPTWRSRKCDGGPSRGCSPTATRTCSHWRHSCCRCTGGAWAGRSTPTRSPTPSPNPTRVPLVTTSPPKGRRSPTGTRHRGLALGLAAGAGVGRGRPPAAR